MEAVITEVNAWAWGVPMQVLLLGTGIFLTLGLGLLPWRKLGFAFRLLLGGFKGQGEGDIAPFRALMTSLSATIGTGNIAGVATAMTLGGPGALFWMWLLRYLVPWLGLGWLIPCNPTQWPRCWGISFKCIG